MPAVLDHCELCLWNHCRDLTMSCKRTPGVLTAAQYQRGAADGWENRRSVGPLEQRLDLCRKNLGSLAPHHVDDRTDQGLVRKPVRMDDALHPKFSHGAHTFCRGHLQQRRSCCCFPLPSVATGERTVSGIKDGEPRDAFRRPANNFEGYAPSHRMARNSETPRRIVKRDQGHFFDRVTQPIVNDTNLRLPGKRLRGTLPYVGIARQSGQEYEVGQPRHDLPGGRKRARGLTSRCGATGVPWDGHVLVTASTGGVP